MPIIKESSYLKRPAYYFNAWQETLAPYFLSKNNKVSYERERFELKDGDFIDLDWIRNDANALIIVSHGFEGNSQDHFIQESATYFASNSFDVLVWHYRSCSKDLNSKSRFYDYGDIHDLHEVITHAMAKGSYDQVVLLGFSMGGNFVLNYLGSEICGDSIKCGIVFSTPMDLSEASRKLSKGMNRWVERSFIKKFKRKIERKASVFPERFDLDKLKTINSLEELISTYVLSQNQGFSDISEYYSRWSSKQFLSCIKVPVLIVNAKNDPLLSKNCFPYDACEQHEFVYLETPKYGGHMGFSKKKDGKRWYVRRIEEFLIRELKL
ncbi:MAG: alpha/beta fold hydrolase [Ekhidna sp.]